MAQSIIRRPFRYRHFNAAFILIGINVLVLFVTELTGPRVLSYLAMNPVLVAREGFLWQLLSYMFVHDGISHILFNMLGLLFFGTQLERRIGSSEFLLFYLLTGFLAGLFSFAVWWFTGNLQIFLVGASGAIYGVLLGFATYFPFATIYVFGILPVKAPILVLAFTAIELFSQLTRLGGRVAHLTHLAGFAAAYLYLMIRLGMNPIKIFLQNRR